MIVEVLSRLTEDFDRGRKWQAFQSLASLAAFILISKDQVHVDAYTRQGDAWIYRNFASRCDLIVLDAIGATLPLTVIYEGTSLDPNAATAQAEA